MLLQKPNTLGLLTTAHSRVSSCLREVALYGQERDTAKVTVTHVDDQEIRFTLTDRMADDWYDYPLTVKIRIRYAWVRLQATRGGKPVGVSRIEHDGKAYALVQAVPDQGEVTLRLSPAAPTAKRGAHR